ncbi:MAG: formate--tetrahydrofolate ligase [Acidobacteria bacterium]|nr:formate--tetrahydrofolate ligase [Acidobacteriota bacterium]
MPTDLEIARDAKLRPIQEVAADMGVPSEYVELRGREMAKISLDAIAAMGAPRAKYVLITATNPTPLGEGKTTTAVGLAQGFKYIDRQAIVSLRQPSLGPTFGIKGGAAGGGHSQVVPMEEMNLHLTGDFHAVTAANNLIAALVDNHIYQGNQLSIGPDDVTWKRVLDVNDRTLRNIVTGLGGKINGLPRETGFDITAASEIMAILGLATDVHDLRMRLGRTLVGYDRHRQPVTADAIDAAGSAAVLLKDALSPNLLQTLEGTPAVVHTGPFANIAHGNSSIVGDYVGIRSGDYLITEAGFGADIGAEKFFNIKCRASGLAPDAAVVVTTVRSMKYHSGNHMIDAGVPLPESLLEENPDDVAEGAANLRRHIGIVRRHGVVPVVSINAFPTDYASEHEVIAKVAESEGVRWAITQPHAEGGPGMVDLARAVEEAAAEGSNFRLLYPDEMPLRDKIETIATEVYGAAAVKFDAAADRQLKRYERLGWGHLPICMAKTQSSLTDNASVLGAPEGWTLRIREVQASVGAGFILPLTGLINRMPGLGATPAAHDVDIDEDGNVVGLS